MRWLILCVLLVGCSSDPLPQSTCSKAMINFYNLGCTFDDLGVLEAMEECKKLPDFRPCHDWVRCLTSMWPGNRCDICERYLEACRQDLTYTE